MLLSRPFRRYTKMFELLSAPDMYAKMQSLQNKQMPYRVINATYTFPVIEKDRFEPYKQERIPMATYFDLDEVADKECGVPHTLPSSSAMKKHLKDLDISVHDAILIYDDFSTLGSARAWWTFKVLGFKSRECAFNLFGYRLYNEYCIMNNV